MKYVYGKCDDPEEQVESINAAHVFSDILALSQESLHNNNNFPNPLNPQPPSSTTSPRSVSQEVLLPPW